MYLYYNNKKIKYIILQDDKSNIQDDIKGLSFSVLVSCRITCLHPSVFCLLLQVDMDGVITFKINRRKAQRKEKKMIQIRRRLFKTEDLK